MNLRPYQEEAVSKTIEFLENETGNPCIVAPTGSGKSLILAELINRLNAPTLILSHRKEILEQNEEKLLKLAPDLNIGVYSASLNRKRFRFVTIGQIQSVVKQISNPELKEFKYIVVDECHLIPKDTETSYRRVIKACENARVIGLTATPIRLGEGYIIGEDQVLNAISYDIPLKTLIDDGYLSPLVGKASVAQADLTDVRKIGGEFVLSEARKRIDTDQLTLLAIAECLKYGANRESWVVFASGVEHALKISIALNKFGVENRVITGETLPLLREKYINEFKNKEIKALINCEVLTTGFDSPNVDFIVLLRATASTSLYVQILGRGMRISEGKKDCLILDFCGNLERHGPIDLINYDSFKEKRKSNGEPPGKICEKCRTLVHAAVRICPECQTEFPKPKPKHEAFAGDGSPLAVVEPPKFYNVTNYYPKVEISNSGIPMLVIVYECGFRHFKEWIFFEHPKAKFKALTWWAERTIGSSLGAPETCEKAKQRFLDECFKVTRVWIKHEIIKTGGKPFPKVVGVSKEKYLLKDEQINDEILF